MLGYINTHAKVQVMVFERVRSRFSNYTRTVVFIRNVIFLSVWPGDKIVKIKTACR